MSNFYKIEPIQSFDFLTIIGYVMAYYMIGYIRDFMSNYFDPQIWMYPGYSRINYDKDKKTYKCKARILFRANRNGSAFMTVDECLVEQAEEIIDIKYNNWLQGKGIYIGGEMTMDSIRVGREDHNYFTAEVYFTKDDVELFREYVKLIRAFEGKNIKASYENPFTGEKVIIERAFIPVGYADELEADFDNL